MSRASLANTTSGLGACPRIRSPPCDHGKNSTHAYHKTRRCPLAHAFTSALEGYSVLPRLELVASVDWHTVCRKASDAVAHACACRCRSALSHQRAEPLQHSSPLFLVVASLEKLLVGPSRPGPPKLEKSSRQLRGRFDFATVNPAQLVTPGPHGIIWMIRTESQMIAHKFCIGSIWKDPLGPIWDRLG